MVVLNPWDIDDLGEIPGVVSPWTLKAWGSLLYAGNDHIAPSDFWALPAPDMVADCAYCIMHYTDEGEDKCAMWNSCDALGECWGCGPINFWYQNPYYDILEDLTPQLSNHSADFWGGL